MSSCGNGRLGRGLAVLYIPSRQSYLGSPTWWIIGAVGGYTGAAGIKPPRREGPSLFLRGDQSQADTTMSSSLSSSICYSCYSSYLINHSLTNSTTYFLPNQSHRYPRGGGGANCCYIDRHTGMRALIVVKLMLYLALSPSSLARRALPSLI